MNASMVPLEKTCSQKCSDKTMEKSFHEITQANNCLLRFCIIVRNYILATYRARSTKNVLDSYRDLREYAKIAASTIGFPKACGIYETS